MAKDPAFLFYTQDFIVGTMHMTYEQRGIYICLLCSQHQHGGLIDKASFNAMVGENEIIRKKFIETNDGFFNERLSLEMAKRAKKSTNLSLNAQKRWQNQCNSNAIASNLHMPIENEDENEDEDNNAFKENKNIKDKKKIFRQPTLEQVIEYCKEIKSPIDPEIFFHTYESTGWIKVTGQKVKNWKSTLRMWEKNSRGGQYAAPKFGKRYSGGSNQENRRKEQLDAIGTESD